MEGAVAGRDADYHGGLLGCRRGGQARDLPLRGRGAWFCYTDAGWGEGRLRFLAEPRNDSGTGWVGGKGRHETCPNGGGVCGSAIRMQVGGRGALDSSRSLGMTVERGGLAGRAGTRPAPTGEGCVVLLYGCRLGGGAP